MIRKYTILGLVQGIGYRPFVAKLADELNIDGWVRNTGGIVTVLAAGSEDSLNELYIRLSSDVPTGGFITSIQVEEIDASSDTNPMGMAENHLPEAQMNNFQILESNQDEMTNLPLIPADICTCDNCKKELLDTNNRRYLHPFISCTICGPRYSILERLPYDRDTITMQDFEMCDECKMEYTGKLDIRRHAQTIACKKCGPKLSFIRISGANNGEKHQNAGNPANGAVHRKFTSEILEYSDKQIEPIQEAIKHIQNGGILAVKDIGGYHLACDPFNETAVANLRLLKHREAKAFAVMFYDLEEAKEYCFINDDEEKLLESPARPIVLLKRKYELAQKLADNVCLTSLDIGALLPCNPVQMLLTKALGPLIMTSGNASGDVLETDDDRMEQWLLQRAESDDMSGVELAMLSHNRRILRPMDDSVMKVIAGKQQFIRRGRGHVPSPISVEIPVEIFASGGDLKSSFCYVKNGLAYVSQYLGDMESVSCQEFYKKEKTAMKSIFGFSPDKMVVDKHPGYFSRSNSEKDASQSNQVIVEVQHHKAHVAAVIAEHKLKGPVLGFAFDGTGYGDDKTIWGSETFLWSGSRMDRVAQLKPTKLIGGDEGAKNCDTILTAMLHGNGLQPTEINMDNQLIMAALDKNINTVTSSSMGRLFDAVSALLDICHYNSYEGQAPIELENVAAQSEKAYPLHIGVDGSTKELFENIVYAISENVPKSELARGFIEAVADYIVQVSKKYTNKLDANKQIVLSGGTFLNRILVENVTTKLNDKGFKVYTAEQLPPGDGGICLGQAFLAQFKD